MSSVRPGPDSGMAMVVALFLLLLLAAAAGAVLWNVGSEADSTRNAGWADAARAQAGAGLEVARGLLAAHVEAGGSFDPALPPSRSSASVSPGAAWGAARPSDPAACPDPTRAGCRDYESFLDQTAGTGLARIYVGRVLRDVGGRALLFDPRDPNGGWAPDLDGDGVADLSGVTVWIRRPLVGAGDADAPHDRAVLTAEARFPPPGSPDEPHAASRLEMTIRLARRPADEAGTEEGYGDDSTTWTKGRLPGFDDVTTIAR